RASWDHPAGQPRNVRDPHALMPGAALRYASPGWLRSPSARGQRRRRGREVSAWRLLQCPLWLLPGLTALGPALGWAAGPFRRGDGADEFATSYATVPCGCL